MKDKSQNSRGKRYALLAVFFWSLALLFMLYVDPYAFWARPAMIVFIFGGSLTTTRLFASKKIAYILSIFVVILAGLLLYKMASLLNILLLICIFLLLGFLDAHS